MYVSLEVLTIIIIFGGLVVSFLVYKRTGIKDLLKKTKEDAILATKLETINQGVINIQVDIKAHNSKFDNMSEKITRCEESVKSAHKRIDDMEFIKRIDDKELKRKEVI